MHQQRFIRVKAIDKGLGSQCVYCSSHLESFSLLKLLNGLRSALAKEFIENLRGRYNISKTDQPALQQGHVFTPLIER